ncbi:MULTISPECIES: hypothetical protein [unclassified Haloferax]|uniref:DUF7322 domain-containing protein n=1 Tax=Haloferax TaxID=2251 RepID=UPI0002B016BB|nr:MULTISPECIES: hypothetical protein [unclassified Haloferax]ELZ58809.1 hypothetical protein C460_08425 [Haloferax sp. ATCC BAA-646]ELZ62851.1 hypothetical protein C458_17910 [Haloferax sp. ATCC BAA-644]ELZ64809.1 hypothetical protein C459_09795 [Haloferax sp. ATCC BAA-645]
MTDDERREGPAADATAEDDDATPPSADVASEIDPEKRWGDPEARWDPETRWGNPETDLPTIPRVRIPGEDADNGEDPDSGDDDAPAFSPDVNPEVARLFWASVVLANVGLAGLTVGPMLVYFRGDTLLGGGLFLFGAVVLVRVYSIYREFKRGEWRDDDGDDSNDGDDSDGDDADDGDSAESDDASGTDDEREDAPERNR